MSVTTTSRVSGWLYLFLAVIGPFAFLLIPERFLVEEMNAFAAEHLGLLAIWIILGLLIIGIEVALSILLWRLFARLDPRLSLLALVFRLLLVVVMVGQSGLLIAVLVNGGEGAEDWIPLNVDGVYLWQIFFAIHLLLLGTIIWRHVIGNWRYLGLFVLIGAFGYLMDSLYNLWWSDVAWLGQLTTVLLVFVTIAELGMAVALLFARLVRDVPAST
jgi:hypothetical protein